MGKNNVISNSQKEIDSLKDTVHQLELENAELKGAKNSK